jgi:hypothetical protein
MRPGEWKEAMEAYRERFGKYPPNNRVAPRKQLCRVKEALEKGEPIPDEGHRTDIVI